MITKSTNPLFAYGTLGFPEIISHLLGRSVVGVPAFAEGYLRVQVKAKVYPAMISGEGTVEGVLHWDLTPQELKLLDTFEDDFYDRITIVVESDNQKIAASAYIVEGSNLDRVTHEEWDRETFAKKHASKYQKMVTEYRRNYSEGHTGSQKF